MQYGVCTGPEGWPAARAAGFDYIEWTVSAALKPGEGRAAFEAAQAARRQAGAPCPALNCFLPGNLKITGPEANPAALEAYVATVCERAAEAGVRTIVFGSGGARRIPAGFDRGRAHAQLASFCRMAAARAAARGVIVAVEPLNRAECNVLTTVRECAALVREVGHPALRLLADAYHLLKDGDAVADVARNGDLLAHVHIATAASRLAPGAEPCDFGPFFQALAAAGYDGCLSIEAKLSDPAVDLPRALAVMKGK